MESYLVRQLEVRAHHFSEHDPIKTIEYLDAHSYKFQYDNNKDTITLIFSDGSKDLVLKAGEWLVQLKNDELIVMDNKEFRSTYIHEQAHDQFTSDEVRQLKKLLNPTEQTKSKE